MDASPMTWPGRPCYLKKSVVPVDIRSRIIMRPIDDRNLILSVDPSPQIDQLATLRAEGEVRRERLILRRFFNFPFARRAPHVTSF
jgi:hypothetical protein